MKNLSRYAKVTRVSNAVAAGTTEITTESVDCQSFESAQFVVLFGAISTGAVPTVMVQGSSDNTTFVDLADTESTILDTDDNKAFVLDVGHPRHRYLRCVITRTGANVAVDGVVAQQYMAQVEPVVHDTASVAGSAFHHAPASA